MEAKEARCGWLWDFWKRKLPYLPYLAYLTYTLFCASHITVFGIAGLVRESNGDANVLGGDEHCLMYGINGGFWQSLALHGDRKQVCLSEGEICSISSRDGEQRRRLPTFSTKPDKVFVDTAWMYFGYEVRITASHSQAWTAQHIARKKPLC